MLRGGKGRKEIKGVQILILDNPQETDTIYMKQQERKRFCSRAGIEAVIEHLKSDFRMGQNYLYGDVGIQTNAFLSCAAWNLKKMMKLLSEKAARFFARIFFRPAFIDFLGFSAAYSGFIYCILYHSVFCITFYGNLT